MALHEPLPRALLLALRRRLDSLCRQDVGHRRPTDLDLQSGPKGVADLRVAPAQIRQRHRDHQLSNVLPFPRSADLAFRAVVLPRRHLPKPPQYRSGLHDLATLLPFFGAQRLAGDGQATSLVRSERNPTVAGELCDDLLENPNFLLLVVQLALHPLVDRTRDRCDEKLERRRQHSWPLCPPRHPDSSCVSPRIRARIPASRSRNRGRPRPPPQIRTGGITASGSCQRFTYFAKRVHGIRPF